MRNIELFDLDGTVIDSSLRVVPCLKPNGDLDLQKYIDEACTPEKIATDTLLPLATYMKQLMAQGKTVVIVTARYMNNADYIFLRQNGLKTAIICSRDRLSGVFGAQEGKRISALGDGEYKRAWFNHLWHTFPQSSFTMYDDHHGVLAVAKEMGFTTYDATIINKMLDASFAAGLETGFDEAESMEDSLIEDVLQCYQKELDDEFLANC